MEIRAHVKVQKNKKKRKIHKEYYVFVDASRDPLVKHMNNDTYMFPKNNLSCFFVLREIWRIVRLQ